MTTYAYLYIELVGSSSGSVCAHFYIAPSYRFKQAPHGIWYPASFSCCCVKSDAFEVVVNGHMFFFPMTSFLFK